MSLSTGEVSSLALDFDRSLDDDCTIYAYQSGTANAYGGSTLAYSTGTADCGFKPARSFTNYMRQLVVPEYDAELRLSLKTALNVNDLIGFNNKNYTVEGINAGKTGKVVYLKRMEIT